jgi:hypothetical protein
LRTTSIVRHGVTSIISVSIPPLCKERIADSRPFPGPFTYTFTFFSVQLNSYFTTIFCCHLGCVWSVLLEPLKPILPAEDQEITSPFFFVKEMMMLLKVEIWASPVDSTITLRFFCSCFSHITYYLVAFFLFATVFLLLLSSSRVVLSSFALKEDQFYDGYLYNNQYPLNVWCLKKLQNVILLQFWKTPLHELLRSRHHSNLELLSWLTCFF